MAVSSIALNPNAVGAAVSQAQVSDVAQRSAPATPARDDSNPSSRTELSDLGRTQLALDNVRDAADTARNLNNPPALSEFRSAVQGVVQSLNALNQTVNTADSTSDRRPVQALNDVRNAAVNANNNGANALQRLGITQQQDGTFAVNQRQLDRAFQQDAQGAQDALQEVASNVDQAAANQQLTGTAEAAPAQPQATQPQQTQNTEQDNNNNDQAAAQAQAQEQASAQARESLRQLLQSQLANAGTNTARNAVTSYFSVSTL